MFFPVFAGGWIIAMPRICTILAISRRFFSFFPGLGVDAVAPPSSLPWLLLCGRSCAFPGTVSAAIGFCLLRAWTKSKQPA